MKWKNTSRLNIIYTITLLAAAAAMIISIAAFHWISPKPEAPETYVLTGDGTDYTVSVTYGAASGIPENAALKAVEILSTDAVVYSDHVRKARLAAGLDADSDAAVRLFDICLVDTSGSEILLSEPVSVGIGFNDNDAFTNACVIHFGDDDPEPRIVGSVSSRDNKSFSIVFEAASFSVYAVVDAPPPAQGVLNTVKNLNEFTLNFSGNAFYLSVCRDGSTIRYWRSDIKNGCFTLADNSPQSAAEWHFEAADGGYRIYTLINGTANYIVNPNSNNNNVGLSESPGLIFNVSEAGNGTFYIKMRDRNKWLQYSNSGGGIRFYQDNNNDGNCKITITYQLKYGKDPYGLDGESYGIAYYDGNTSAAAMSAEGITVNSQQRLNGLDLTMQPDVLSNNGILFVNPDEDAQKWTFESVNEDLYYLSADTVSGKKYLVINGANLTLAAEPDPVFSLVKAIPGTGAESGKWHFTVNGYSLNMPGNSGQGFNAATGSGIRTWLSLIDDSILGNEDFITYTARKVSVSDTVNMHNGQEVVIYTRVWNDSIKRYEFFVVDYNGDLIRGYDSGDTIKWIGTQVNTALWKFTEYYNSDGTVNNYYDFQNTQYGNYIAPQVSQGQILSAGTIGVMLNGRRYGETRSTIIAWDDFNYSYSGIKAQDGRIVASSLSESEPFYFAIMEPEDPDNLTIIDTIDSNAYGIRMRMVDFNNAIVGDHRDYAQDAFMGTYTGKGLLSTDLGDDGYPTGSDLAGTIGQGQSLSNLFNDMSSDGKSVNHLFLKSIYNESGYFEYDSTSNFAHLNDDGNFTVYGELGAITGLNEWKNTRTHGQFMPYDDIQAGVYAYGENGVPITNLTNVLGAELSDLNARKGEKLYDLGKTTEVDYFFGMELEAGFTQTAGGLDAFGHDIVFEFSGDDDFWLYVDGELVIDLGGIHVAQVGSVNFRTGIITSSNGDSTLYDTFRNNYEARGLSESEISQKLSDIFTLNSDGQYVFKSYTNHTMKMFYMERGSGASNLHMRFNLASVKPGTFQLSKKLSGTDHADNSLIEFPYQVWFYTRADGETLPHLLGENDGDTDRATYLDSTNTVKYMPDFTPVGSTTVYHHVFFLKPGETAEFNMPDDTTEYYVVECGVDTSAYGDVYANGTKLNGTPIGSARQDFAVQPAELDSRPRLEFDNHVKPGAMRTLNITKRLYDSDGTSLIHYPDDDMIFDIRLYLGNENTAADDLALANMYPYYVKDDDGNYCRWDVPSQSFVSVGITDYTTLSSYLDTLPSAERESIEFICSMYGSITKIPADHTVEVRDLIIGTHYMPEERDWEVPKGYTRRDADGYTRVDVDPPLSQSTPISGTMQADETPHIEIRNQIGWGLTIEKIWTDKDFMATHDPVYFAVYMNDELIDGTVRQLTTSESEIYYFFDDLYDDEGFSHQFSEYRIYEVTIGNPDPVVVDGLVTDPGTVAIIPEDGTLEIGGTPVGGNHQTGYRYTVNYQIGTPTGHNENVRTDKAINSIPGIELYKEDWQGGPLANAVFTLKKANGEDVAAPSFTSGSDGLITIANLSEGDYLLAETSAPNGFVVLDTPMTIHVDENGEVTVSGIDNRFYEIRPSQTGMLITIVVKDRPVGLLTVKVDCVTRQPLEGIHFALYRQVIDNQGIPRKDYLPMTGYEDLVTDINGVLSAVSLDLDPGTYYLTETQTLADDYVLWTEDLCFTIGTDGIVTVVTEAWQDWVSRSEDDDGVVTYTLALENDVVPPDPITVSFPGTKDLKGRRISEGEFGFTMTPVDADDTPIGVVLTAYCTAADGGDKAIFTFTVTYDLSAYKNAIYHNEDGDAVFYYIVAEIIPDGADDTGYVSADHIRYALNKYRVTVTLHHDRTAHLLTADWISEAVE